jgi:dephospho-CoA kinase
MWVVGLTGGVGSGKSTVAEMLREHGARVIDADRLAREVVEPGEPALAAIRDAFGGEVLLPDGRLDRATLAARVFSDDEARARLDGIVHPEIAARARAAMDQARADGVPWVVYDVPLLYENGLESMCDRVVVVTATDAQRCARLAGRSGWSESEISARMAAQMPLADKADRADDVIDNSGSLDATRAQVRALVERLAAEAR